jgi:CRISPR-associated protein Cmr4
MNNNSISSIYILNCLTNLHVGSGAENYGIIDNLVQRDSATRLPVVHASSLKGALRENFEQHGYEVEAVGAKWKTHEVVKHIFGSHPLESDGKSTQGVYKFFSAHLLSIPVRSNIKPYFNATSSGIIKDFLTFCEALGFPIKKEKVKALEEFSRIADSPNIFERVQGAVLEGKAATSNEFDNSKLQVVKELIGNQPAFYSDTDFQDVSEGLPVIARNHLENGISQNLWYEEIVPRQSRFYFAVIEPTDDAQSVTFDKMVASEGPVQIGANATVGYGYCKITKLHML